MEDGSNVCEYLSLVSVLSHHIRCAVFCLMLCDVCCVRGDCVMCCDDCVMLFCVVL